MVSIQYPASRASSCDAEASVGTPRTAAAAVKAATIAVFRNPTIAEADLKRCERLQRLTVFAIESVES